MKSEVSITLISTLIVTVVSAGSVQNQARANTNITNNQQVLNPKNQVLRAKRILCRPKIGCFSRGGRDSSLKIISPDNGEAILDENNGLKLSWLAVPKEKNYHICIKSSEKIIWKKEINLDNPQSTPNLIVEKNPDGTPILITITEKQLLLEPNQEYTVSVESQKNRTLVESIFKLSNPTNPKEIQKEPMNDQAYTQFRLGSKNVANKKWDAAIYWLLKAHASYQASNNSELSTQVAQSLGEVYNLSGNREQAILWYQQAKTGYEVLNDNDQEMLKYVEQELKKL